MLTKRLLFFFKSIFSFVTTILYTDVIFSLNLLSFILESVTIQRACEVQSLLYKRSCMCLLHVYLALSLALALCCFIERENETAWLKAKDMDMAQLKTGRPS